MCAPGDLGACVRQSCQDTWNLRWPREQFLYGEVNILSFTRVLDRVAALRTRVLDRVTACFDSRSDPCGESWLDNRGQAAELGGAFYDLGCGAGKAVLTAAMHPSGFRRCVGIELLPGLHRLACCLRDRLLADEAHPKAEVEFFEGDLFEADVRDASLIFVNAGNWREPNVQRLFQHLLQSLPHGAMLATVRKPLAVPGAPGCVGEDCLQPLEKLDVPMSWGLAPVYLAVRKRPHAEGSSPALLTLQLDLNEMD